MSKPIRDAYGKIIGYESGDLPLPIQRDVVFAPRPQYFALQAVLLALKLANDA
jgi:hypothetical protein